VKVWVYRGDMQPEAKQAPPVSRRAAADAAAAPAGDK
jgi:hypothetical protein